MVEAVLFVLQLALLLAGVLAVVILGIMVAAMLGSFIWLAASALRSAWLNLTTPERKAK